MSKITLDGQEVEIGDGTTILQAARTLAIPIPTFCYQDRLAPVASCRMCLVEVEGRRKLEPACATVAMDGMVVRTRTDLVAQTRQSMLEFLLANHPLDCPICDKAGECELQDTVFAYGAGETRFHDRKRVFRTRDIDLNQVIIFNANRCIQCQRCVRMCEEVVGAVALGTAEKGMDSEITGFEGSLAGCDHCGNCIEVCPVGALMSKPYRYRARPWDLKRTDTLCNFCGTGCQLTVDMRDGELARVHSKYETGINEETLCVKGRFGFDFIDAEGRIEQPMIRRDGELVPLSWPEAIGCLKDRAMQTFAEGKQIGGIASARQNNEALYLFQKMMRIVFRSNHIDCSTRFAGEGLSPALAATLAPLYSRRPFKEVAGADVLLILGSNVTDDNPVSDYLLRTIVQRHGNALFVASARPSRLDAIARAHVRLLPGEEPGLLASLAGAAPDAAVRGFVETAAGALSAARSVTILLGSDLFRTPAAPAALCRLRGLADRWRAHGKDIALQCLFDRPNQWGAWELGLAPDRLPGWDRLDDQAALDRWSAAWGAPLSGLSGLDARAMIGACADGRLGMLYLFGADPLRAMPGRAAVAAALEAADFLVVQDAFMSDIAAQHAHLLLPCPTFGEEAGSMTNNEGRVQRLSGVREPTFDAVRSTEIFGAVARAFGHTLDPTGPDAVFEEIATLVPAYRGLTADMVASGTAFTRVGGTAPPEFSAPDTRPAHPRAGTVQLIAGDTMFLSGTLSEKSSVLASLGGTPYVELHPDDLPAGVGEGDDLVLTGPDGTSLTLRTKLNSGLRPGTVFIPEAFGANRLMPAAPGPHQVHIGPKP